MEKWADAVDDQSYTFANLLPYFDKSIRFQLPDLAARPSNSTPHLQSYPNAGQSGPLSVSYAVTPNVISSFGEAALKELGFDAIRGFLNGSLLGYDYMTQTLDSKSQVRSSSETSFLRNALKSTSNLVIHKSTLAKRILFDSTKRATGVVVNTAGAEYVLSARREVVLSAGAFRSPQLLMVSGIGPKAQLQPFGIPMISELSGVGENMWDQVDFGVSQEVDLITHSRLANPAFFAGQVESYNANRTGQLTNTGADFIGWEKLPSALRRNLANATREGLATFPADWPELELLISDGYGGRLRDLLTGAPADGKDYASIAVGLLATFSRGRVTINSTDTAANPLVDPNLFGDPRDRDLAVQAFRRVRQIWQARAFQGVVRGSEAFPGANVTTDAQILVSVLDSSNTIYHASATNAMGRKGDPKAVVDSKARVFGVSGLRVVDASIFPFLPPGHPQSVVCQSSPLSL